MREQESIQDLQCKTLLTPRDCARMLSISLRTFERRIAPLIRRDTRIGRLVRYRPADVYQAVSHFEKSYLTPEDTD